MRRRIIVPGVESPVLSPASFESHTNSNANHQSMRSALKVLFCLVIAAPLFAQRDSATITIHAARALDGRGAAIANALITVRDGKIVSVAPAKAGAPRATY